MDGIIQYNYNCTMNGVTLVYEWRDYIVEYQFQEDICYII